MAIPSRMQDRTLVLSKLKQTDYFTYLTDVNLQAGKRVTPEAALFGQPTVKRWSDQMLSMRGHSYGTQLLEVERDLTDALTLTGDPWLLAWAFAFAMGKVTSSQPNAAGAPTAWQHVIKPQDPIADGKSLPVTTIYSEVNTAANLQRRLQSMCVKSVSLDFPANAPLKLSVDLIGSGQVQAGNLSSQPSLMTLIPLLSNNLVFKYGTQAAPADISSEVVAGSVKLQFSWNFDDANSRAPSGGLYRSRAWLTRPDISLTFNRFVDDAASTPNDDFFSDAIKECRFSVQGPNIAASEFYLIDVRLLAVVPTVVKIGQSGDKSVYQYTISPDHVLKQGSADVIVVTAENTETSFLV